MPNDDSCSNKPASDAQPADIGHNSALQRFTTTIDGHKGYVEYQLDDGTMVITHTVVPPAIGGRGIAGQLVRAAFEHARSHGLRVRPACSYAESWVRMHQAFADLLI